jgi:CubicO group peptidase (beta-lactamase class C family)
VRPESVGVDAAIIEHFVQEIADAGCELHSFMLYRSGGVIAEDWWWPYGPERVHFMHSATKSFTATGVGLAISEGRFRLQDKVVDFFPERIPADASENLLAMTVEDLLTQTSGHKWGVSGSTWRGIPTSWIDEFLKIRVRHVPGTTFVYSSATSFMLSAIVTRTTGANLFDFMTPRFFQPLGMTHARWDIGPENINPGGNGLSCTTSDLLKLGVLYLRHGNWQGVRILDPHWVVAATRDAHGDGYGYHWWLGADRRTYMAAGAFGQYSFVFPDHDAVLALTAANDVGDSSVRRIVAQYFPAIFESAGAGTTPRTAAPPRRLLPDVAPSSSPLAPVVSGRVYRMDPNEDRVRSVRLEFTPDACVFSLTDDRGEHEVGVGLQDWLEGSTSMSGGALHHGYEPDELRVVASGVWISDDTFEMTWQFAESPFRDTVRVRFADSTITLDRKVNVNTGPTARPTIAGAAESVTR